MVGNGSLDELKSTFTDDFIKLQAVETEVQSDELFVDGPPSSPPPSPVNIESMEKINKESIFQRANSVLSGSKMSETEYVKEIVYESRKSGTISWSVYWEYTRGVINPLKYGIWLVVCVLITQLMNNFVDWWLNKWSVKYSCVLGSRLNF